MASNVPDALVVQGMVDGDGRLTAADPRLAALQKAAGGEAGGQLAVPPLASVARLARTLAIPVSRGIVVGGADHDLDLWVRAQPDGGGVRLAITGWQERAPFVPSASPDREIGFAALEQDGEWACDGELHLTRIDGGLEAIAGQKLTHAFRLIEDDAGDLPFVDALAARAAFARQTVELRREPDQRLLLHGHVVIGPDGGFAGYAGGFRVTRGVPAVSARAARAGPEPLIGPDVAARLDGALRGPLHRIIANADAIAARDDGPLREDYAAYAGNISAASRHLLGLVDDLGDLQAVEQAGFTIDTDTIDLSDIARRAASLLGVRATDRGVRIDPPAKDELLSATGDFRRVLQILVNLVGNAVRYSPPGSSVWIRLEEEGDLAAVIVADQGQGIAAEDQDRIFEKFERLDPSEPGGSGLGLYISRRLARAMGGDITIDSAPGQGARFALTLPVQTEPTRE